MPRKKVKEATMPSKPKKAKSAPKKTTTSKKRKGAGRPPKYSEAEKLQKKIDEYFDRCEKLVRPVTVTGLAMACGLTRQQLINYECKEEFKPIIIKAKQIVEMRCEEALMDPSAKNVTGIIFTLKNNWGWQDKSDVSANLSVNDTKIIGKDGLELEIPD